MAKIIRSKVTSVEWTILFTAAAFVDLAQGFLVETVIIGTVIDIFFGAALLIYLFLRGEFKNHQTRNRVFFAFLATFALELIPGLNVAPFWFLDIGFCIYQAYGINNIAQRQEEIMKEETLEAQIQAQREQIMAIMELQERQNGQMDTSNEMKRELIKKNMAQAEKRKQQKEAAAVVQR